MKSSKNLKAFTLIEVAVSLLIIGISITPILILQGNIFKKSKSSFNEINRIFVIKNSLTTKKLNLTVNKNNKVNITETEIDNNSDLKKIKDIKILKATQEWGFGKNKKSQTIIELLYKPEEGKK